MNRPFRILFVDDDLWKDEMRSGEGHAPRGIGAKRDLLKDLKQLHEAGPSDVQLFLTGSVGFSKDKPKDRFHSLIGDDPWEDSYLDSLDVLILDLGGVGQLGFDNQVDESTIKAIPDLPDDPNPEEIDQLNFDYPGAGFLISNWQDQQSWKWQVVFLLTQYEREDPPEVIERFVYPLTKGSPLLAGSDLTVSIHSALLGGSDDLYPDIRLLYDSFSEGYTRLVNRDAINFAALHDFPVLIVGETGTGKEYVANSIHRGWAREKLDRGIVWPTRIGEKNLPQAIREIPFVALNCSGLNADLAQAELFGAVKGSYTDLNRHRLGAILSAAKINLSGSASSGKADTDAEDFRERLSSSWLEKDGGDLRLVDQLSDKQFGPQGVLFLDELAELPSKTQALLLRFLQNGEVKPLGYPGRILNVKLKVIAATNDPYVAGLAGEELRSFVPSNQMNTGFRGDLVSRLKQNVIKTEAINSDNASEWVDHFVSDAPSWTPEARDKLVGLLESKLERMEDIQSRGSRANGAVPFFANRRELQQIVELASVYATPSRQPRGKRTVHEVTPKVVEHLWNPSYIMAPQLNSLEDTSPAVAADSESSDEMDTWVQELYEWLERLFEEEFEKELADNWNSHPERAGITIRRFVKTLKEDQNRGQLGKIRQVIYASKPVVREKAFDVPRNTVRDWFRKSGLTDQQKRQLEWCPKP